MSNKIESEGLVAERLKEILRALHESDDSVSLWRFIGFLAMSLGVQPFKNSEGA